MATYLTVDGGTTNTRLFLVIDGNIRDMIKLEIGARDEKVQLELALKNAISEMLVANELKEQDVTAVIASGMITSERGLMLLKHLTAPIGIDELHQGIYTTDLPNITSIPFAFIPGVKTNGESIGTVDMIRGEETELMGLLEWIGEDTLVVLPGSHSKLIEMDSQRRITNFHTAMTGELLSAVINSTILKDSVNLKDCKLIEDYLYQGYENFLKNGLNQTLFEVRILRNLFSQTASECFSYLLGGVLCGEIGQILNSCMKKVILGGQKQLREATNVLLKKYSDKQIIILSDETVDCSTAHGAIMVYENR